MRLKFLLILLTLTMGLAGATEVVAHRGASGKAPENTIAAIAQAIRLGSHFVEIDVQLSSDGEVVVIHDETVDRTTDGVGSVGSKSLKELKSLDAGAWFGESFRGERIPTLAEVLALDLKNSKLIIEVKNKDNVYPGLEEKIVKLVGDSGKRDLVLYKSFGIETLAIFRKLDPLVDTVYVLLGPVIDGVLVIDDWARFGSMFDVDADYYQVHRLFAGKKLVKKIHARGKKIIVWDVQEAGVIKKHIENGVDVIETDFPSYVLDLK